MADDEAPWWSEAPQRTTPTQAEVTQEEEAAQSYKVISWVNHSNILDTEMAWITSFIALAFSPS